MLTPRSSVLLLIAAIAIFSGLLQPNEGVALAGLTLLFWLAFQWFVVQWAIRSRSGIIRHLTRTLDGNQQSGYTLAVDQTYNVQLSGDMGPGHRGFRISIRDVLPEACRIVDGYSRLTIDKQGENRFTLSYRICPRVCGRMQISGVMVTIEDTTGMFRGQRYLPLHQKLTVLPFLIRPQTTASALKINNVQRVIGHHRHKSPGMSAELLEIRDYQTGDPPRSIAWKPTARLGRLMSCEFESVVPIRATIFTDLSGYQFVGRPGTAPADRVITSVASVARLLLSDRDPVACVMATENGAARIPHGHGERQLSRLMHYLLAAADPNPRLEYVTDEDLVQIVFRECYRRFPRLFDRWTSFVPIGRSWWRPFRRKSHRIKCRLAPVLCELLDLPPGREYRLIYDSEAMRSACETWLHKFPIATVRIKPPLHLHDQSLRSLTTVNICQRILEAHARAKDNELFVIVGSWPASRDDAQRLLNVVRVCRAAGHHVIYIDAGLPNRSLFLADPVARELLQQAHEGDDPETNGFVGNELTAMGVRCAQISDPRLMETVAVEVDLIRSGKFRGTLAGRGRRSATLAGMTP